MQAASSAAPPSPLAFRALDLALPAALAAEAARHRFPAGPLRERWISSAAAPATRTALLAIGATRDLALAAAYLEHLAATTALPHSADATPAALPDLLSLPAPAEPAPAGNPDDLALAAGGAATEPHSTPELPLPPRVRANPAVPSPLEPWLDLAHQRHGIPVRDTAVVRSW